MRFLGFSPFVLLAVCASAQTRVQDVIYLKQDGCAFTMDVFKPKSSNHKAVVWIVSAGWASNHESINTGVAQQFMERGYTVFEVVHGSQPKYSIADIVPQVRHAIRFIRSQAAYYGISPRAIGVCGASAGGHLCLEIGGLGDDGDPSAKDPVNRVGSRANAIVAFMPPTDFQNWGSVGKTPFEISSLAVLRPAFDITSETPPDERRRIARNISTIYLVKPGFPPTLLIHGDTDNLVPIQQSIEFDRALESSRIVHKLLVVHGSGHDWVTYTKGLPTAIDWFDTCLAVSPN